MYEAAFCPWDTMVVVLFDCEVTLRSSSIGWAKILPEKTQFVPQLLVIVNVASISEPWDSFAIQ